LSPFQENLNKWVIDQVITKVGPTLLDGFVQDVKTAWQSKLAANMALQMIPDTSPSASSSAGTTSQPAAASGIKPRRDPILIQFLICIKLYFRW